MALPDNWKELLFDAAKCGDLARLKRLKKAGADVMAKDRNGWSLLHWLAYCGQVDAARWFIEEALYRNSSDSPPRNFSWERTESRTPSGQWAGSFTKA